MNTMHESGFVPICEVWITWIALLMNIIGHAYENHDFGGAAFSALLYLARHAAIYMSLAKFAIEWDTGLFEANGR